MNHSLSQLDNPIWNALNSTQLDFAQGTDHIKKYTTDILPFMGLESPEGKFLDEMLPFLEKGEEVFIGGNLPELPANWTLVDQVDCFQMVSEKLVKKEVSSTIEVLKMTVDDYEEMVALINFVQPGYVKPRTPLIGNYYGIKVENKLVAVSGERFKMDGFCELSAICTHPDFTGKGFAQQLMLKIIDQIYGQDMTPFLHVGISNARAIGLYEYLGFKKRRDFTFYKVKSTQ